MKQYSIVDKKDYLENAKNDGWFCVRSTGEHFDTIEKAREALKELNNELFMVVVA